MDMSPAARRRRRRRVPDANRKRAPRACVRCKARKSKCIEVTLGCCQRCRLKSLPCVFERERSPTEATISAVSVSENKDSVASHSAHASEPDDSQESIIVAGSSAPPEPTRSNAGDTKPHPSPADTFSVDGHPSERIMWPRFLCKLRETFSLEARGSSSPNVAQTSRVPPPLNAADLRRLRKAADAFPPRPVADFLLSVCIEHGTDSFFYFDQVQFLAEIDTFYTDTNSRLRYDIAFICLAHAVFALGSQWTSLARPNGRKPPPILQEDSDPGRIFYSQARSLIPDVMDLPSLRAVQATFVLGVYLLPASSIGSAYLYLGMSLRKALAMDLHLNADELGIADEEEKEIRKRIWWAVYSLERSTTVKLNRPRTVNASIITVDFPSPFPALDDHQKFNNIQHQIADAKLMLILDRVAEPSEWADAPNALSRFGAELKQWKRSLPPTLKLTNMPPKSSSYRATFHLYLNYYFAWIAMGKVSVVSVVRARLRHAFGSPTALGPPNLQHSASSSPPQVEEHTENMSRSCIKAAKKMLRLFEDLSRTGNLTRFSFTDFQGCSIATIVVLLAGIVEHDDPSFERQANFGLNCLRKMAEGGNSAGKTGVGFVEALQGITSEASEKLKKISSLAALAPPRGSITSTETPTGVEAQPVPVQDQPAALSQDHYNGWVEWLSRQPAYQFSPNEMTHFPGAGQGLTQQHLQLHNSGYGGGGVGVSLPPVSTSQAGRSNSVVSPGTWQAGVATATGHNETQQVGPGFSTWDGAAALQQLSAQEQGSAQEFESTGTANTPMHGNASIMLPHHQNPQNQQHQQQQQQQQSQYAQHIHQQQQQMMDQQQSVSGQGNGQADFSSTLYTDNQAFLMGLTGWDVLGFSELYE